ncbi:MAG TPA: N4-gp56 family major capsid protein [Porticoccaceae bacterium]|nr:N4-gp56 family major capsid protein [Porticoccaceae bacterium]
MAGQVWSVNTSGGYMYADNLSRLLRMSVQPMVKFRQFCDVKDAAHQGLHRGDTFHWNVYSDVATQGTTLTETSTIPETSFTISQGTMTITEAGNSVPFTGKLDDLSEQPVAEVVRKVLKNDAKKGFDNLASTQFNACKLRVVPTAGTSTTALTLTTNGAAGINNNVALGKEHVKLISDIMKERNIPAYADDDYYALAWPSTWRTLKNDLEAIKQYIDAGFQMIMNGEIGRYDGVRFVEQTHVKKGSLGTAGTEGVTSTWTNAKSDWAFFFGEDTCAEAIAIPEEIRGKIPGDFGRDRGVAWYYLGGFGLIHTQAAQSRIVMWDSAA